MADQKIDKNYSIKEIKKIMKITNKAQRQEALRAYVKEYCGNLGEFLKYFWEPLCEVGCLAAGITMIATGNYMGFIPLSLPITHEMATTFTEIFMEADSDLDTVFGQIFAPGWMRIMDGTQMTGAPLISTIKYGPTVHKTKNLTKAERIRALKDAGIINEKTSDKKVKQIARQYKPCFIQIKGKKVQFVFAKKVKNGLYCFSADKNKEPFFVESKNLQGYVFTKKYTSLAQLEKDYERVMEIKQARKNAKEEKRQARYEKKKAKWEEKHPNEEYNKQYNYNK